MVIGLIIGIGVTAVLGYFGYNYVKDYSHKLSLTPRTAGILQSATEGIPYIVPGAGALFLNRYIPPNMRGASSVLGLGLIGLGAYKWYSKYNEYKDADFPEEGDKFTLSIKSPNAKRAGQSRLTLVTDDKGCVRYPT